MSSCQAGKKLPGDSILAGFPADPNSVLRVQVGGTSNTTEEGLGAGEYTEEGYYVLRKRKSQKYLRLTHKHINTCISEKVK